MWPQEDRELEVSGPDQAYSFWVKHIMCLHDDLTHNYNLLFQDPDSVPNWLSQGTITLIPENDKTDQAKNYRSITCLSVFYKTFTSVVRPRIAGHFVQGNLMASEQNGCQQGSLGAKDQLLIKKLLTEDCKTSTGGAWLGWTTRKSLTAGYFDVFSCIRLVQS